ncbi:hypothetical protein [Caulobacter soli]|uniref:hypothetical protein n=1 Tax=Caulobacter soli TaxID=2708539 RepID=UPI0013EB75C9|nr:hypothetical protein [Caulobacter soli]
MSSRLVSAVVAGLAIAIAPMGASIVSAQTPAPASTAPTAAQLQALISASAREAAAAPGFASMTPAAKLDAIKAAVAKALAASGASPAMIQAALIQAVASGVISAGVAIAVAASISPEMAQAVSQAPAVVAQLKATGQSATVTGATSDAGNPSVLVNLQGDGGGGGAAATPYDPCAGVIASYCGG